MDCLSVYRRRCDAQILASFCSFFLCSKCFKMMYAITLVSAMALELENVYVGTDGEVTTSLVGIVGIVSIFMCGFSFGAM